MCVGRSVWVGGVCGWEECVGRSVWGGVCVWEECVWEECVLVGGVWCVQYHKRRSIMRGACRQRADRGQTEGRQRADRGQT